jgi:hypothetical protein
MPRKDRADRVVGPGIKKRPSRNRGANVFRAERVDIAAAIARLAGRNITIAVSESTRARWSRCTTSAPDKIRPLADVSGR